MREVLGWQTVIKRTAVPPPQSWQVPQLWGEHAGSSAGSLPSPRRTRLPALPGADRPPGRALKQSLSCTGPWRPDKGREATRNSTAQPQSSQEPPVGNSILSEQARARRGADSLQHDLTAVSHTTETHLATHEFRVEASTA